MANITVDFNTLVGTIKPMHAGGQPPLRGTNFDLFHYLKEVGMPYSRLHDTGGAYGGNRWVDIPNIFRDFDADVNDPASYDFTFTDMLITAMVENGLEPVYRLGVTIENDAYIKAYRIYPPKDNLKWAQICEHIIRHYTEGWADGFHYTITYWEIWNEPDNWEDPMVNSMWRGTKEQYFELYRVATTYLKEQFPHLKFGGYASCGFYALKEDKVVTNSAASDRAEYFIEFFDAFLDYVKEHRLVLDFFSWHSYDPIENNRKYAHYVRDRLDAIGYTHTETTCNEWNPDVWGSYAKPRHAALTAGMMLMWQDTPLDSAMFYDCGFGSGNYRSLFNPITTEPFPVYYAFAAFNELYQRRSQAAVTVDTENVYAVAAAADTGCVVIANTNEFPVPLHLDCGRPIIGAKMVDETRSWMDCELPQLLPASSVLCVFTA